MDNTINTSSYINNYTNYCSYRLPCGICQRTNSICPLSDGTWTPTWTSVTSAWQDPISQTPYTTTSAKSEGKDDK